MAYTGTHDNDTMMGWARGAEGDSTRTAEEVARERTYAEAYLAASARELHWAAIRGVLASVADTAIVPVQDVLGLGSEARMNTPGVDTGNWRWQADDGAFTAALAARLRRLVESSDRA